jgi:NarL family two-component system response regulator LiaR
MPDTIRVLVCDDHEVVREGLSTFLASQDDIEIAGQAANGEEAVEMALELQPDVILMDVMMPLVDGIEAIRRIMAEFYSAKIIVLSSFADDEQVFPAIRAGAVGYLMKDVSPTDLAKAIRMAVRGEPLLHPDVARRLMKQVAHPTAQPETLGRLTEREVEVLRLIASGRSNKEIALDLTLSEKTVKTHVSNILQKLNLADRTQAALFAVRQGLG